MPDRDTLLCELRRVAETVGAPPTANDYREHGNYSVSPFYDEFGSWTEAREAAGVDGEVPNPRRIEPEQILGDIQQVAESVDGVPTKGDYKEHGKHSISVVYRRFDSWTKARQEAGIRGKPTSPDKIPRKELLDGLKQFAKRLGETPTRNQMNKEGPFSGSAYRREFGSWNSALEATALQVNQPSNAEMKEVDCYWCETTLKRERAQIQDQKRVFCSRECKREYQASDEHGGENHPLSDRVEVACAWCEKTLRRKPSVVSERERLFCDYDCFGSWASVHITGEDSPRWKGGGELYYGPNWRRQRRKRLEYDDYECQRCGLTVDESKDEFGRELEVHHQAPVREFYDGDDPPDWEVVNDLDNLVTLCLPCHRKVEKLPVQPVFD